MYLFGAGTIDVATRNGFSRFAAVSLECSRLFCDCEFEKNCSQQYGAPNKDASFKACFFKVEDSSSLM